MSSSGSSLVVLGCSATKFDIDGNVPAVHLYDGPFYRVLRSHLRSFRWSEDLSISVLSAKYGLIGALAPIAKYDRRMTEHRANQLRTTVNDTLNTLSQQHKNVHFMLGKDYLQSIDAASWSSRARLHYAEGGIGMKLHSFSQLLGTHAKQKRVQREISRNGRPLYFLPDWDDFLDADYDFRKDAFSSTSRAKRNELHTIQLLKPTRICDGVLVSLAQHLGSKGLLKRVPLDDPTAMRPRSVRDFFGLSDDQWAFGDCGAFSYSGSEAPSISVDQAVAVYELYEFDLGASVDHIPLPEIVTPEGKRRRLSKAERLARIVLTKNNAQSFIDTWKSRGCCFAPVGVIQGLESRSYGQQVHEYMEMGYSHIALGGLVPRSDDDIKDIATSVAGALKNVRRRPWIHLLGVYRPNIQDHLRLCGIDSFDSATYFRKAWLRSDQNYLGTDGDWYAAIRVPPTSDGRTMMRLKESGKRESTIKRWESEALRALRRYDAGRLAEKACLDAVMKYDQLLNRGELTPKKVRSQYRHTLQKKPWQACKCAVCKDIGIDVVIFRGCNRNKRRGAHNTSRLYSQLGG